MNSQRKNYEKYKKELQDIFDKLKTTGKHIEDIIENLEYYADKDLPASIYELDKLDDKDIIKIGYFFLDTFHSEIDISELENITSKKSRIIIDDTYNIYSKDILIDYINKSLVTISK